MVLIVAVLLGIGSSVIGEAFANSRLSTSLNSISVSVASANRYATRLEKPPLITGLRDGWYSGVAVLFMPDGELRIIENNQYVKDAEGSFLETYDRPLDGFTNIPGIEFIKLSNDIGVFGIKRTEDGMELIPPPFVIWYDEFGKLKPGGQLYYDGDYNGFCLTDDDEQGIDRLKPFVQGRYDPDMWYDRGIHYPKSPFDDSTSRPGVHPDIQAAKLPYERMETVISVLVYHRSRFRRFVAEEYEFDDQNRQYVKLNNPKRRTKVATDRITKFDPGTAGHWLLTYGRKLFFNRYTGTVAK